MDNWNAYTETLETSYEYTVENNLTDGICFYPPSLELSIKHPERTLANHHSNSSLENDRTPLKMKDRIEAKYQQQTNSFYESSSNTPKLETPICWNATGRHSVLDKDETRKLP